MQWIVDNWVLVLFGGGMLAMHLFGHRKHGGKGHGGGCCGGKPSSKPDGDGDQDVHKGVNPDL